MARQKKDIIREQAEGSLEAFIRLIHPVRVLGSVHSELIRWWCREDAKSHQLTLLPRDHQKSAMIAYRAAWEITKNPAIRILYISSTSGLAIKQLKFIRDILDSKIYRFYWPEMLHPDEGKREKWTETEISVDHPKRKEENVRDCTVFTGGLTTTLTGLHCDIAILDDVVVFENAYTEEGREKVARQYSLLASIETSDAREWVVGTRYHPKDLYGTLQSKEVDQYSEEGELSDAEALYETFERTVENIGDGTGEFLWPRQQRYDGRWFGFNKEILAKKRSQYLDRTQYRAQYYNDPNDIDNAGISREYFQYYDRAKLSRFEGRWQYNGKRLNVFAAIDFAWSLAKKSDYTAIVVVGVDGSQNFYILDIERFKTGQISEYFNKILKLHQKWDFRKINAETTAAQAVVVEDLKLNYIRKHGLSLSIDSHKPNRHEGAKEERVYACLQPKYENGQIWHYEGGNCQILEEELVLQHPAHDDVKDCLSICLDICVAPTGTLQRKTTMPFSTTLSNSRFGGIA